MDTSLEISRMLTCSTAHIPVSTALALNGCGDQDGLPLFYTFNYGWLKIDSDGPVINELSTYTW